MSNWQRTAVSVPNRSQSSWAMFMFIPLQNITYLKDLYIFYDRQNINGTTDFLDTIPS